MRFVDHQASLIVGEVCGLQHNVAVSEQHG